MSVRAHRVKKIEYDRCSFNLWHHQELSDFLGVYEQLNEDACGLVEVSVEKLKEAVETLSLDTDTKKLLEDDIAFAEKNGNDYVMYYCF